jgi:hypothetical protein
VECNNCTLQLIQMMTTAAVRPDTTSDDIYACVDLVFERGPHDGRWTDGDGGSWAAALPRVASTRGARLARPRASLAAAVRR